jgi:antiviral helicase SKI2
VQKECELPEAPEDFVNRTLSFGLGPVVLSWAHGCPFADVAKMAGDTAQEGVIVRCVVRLDELLRNIADAAFVIGNRQLKDKVEEASRLIRRDIIFAPSLYTQ